MNNPETKWEKYEPIKIPIDGERYFIQNYSFTNDGHDKIILSNGIHCVNIEFQGYTWATRISDDGDRVGGAGGKDSPVFFSNPPKPLKDDDFIFKGYNTEFIQWIITDSCGAVAQADELIHYCIMDTLLVIDVLGVTDPKIAITETSKDTSGLDSLENVEVSKSEFEEFQAWKASKEKR
jgi:hypothetical protein